MCASCGCGCKPGKEQKGCKCTCKTCREARTMSVEKFHLVNKAQRGFDVIADAILDDVYEEDLVVDDEGNVYALVGEIQKSEKSRRYASNAAMGAGAAGIAGGAGLAGAGYNVMRRSKDLTGYRGLGNALGGAGLMVRGSHIAGAGAGVGAAGLGLRAYNKKKSRVEKADDSHRNAKIGAGIGVAGAAGLTASQAKELRMGHALGRALGISNSSMNRAYAKGLGRRFGLAAGGGALGGAAVDYARNKKR